MAKGPGLISTLKSVEVELASLRFQLGLSRADLSGKDWLTVEEAAFYCGVSTSQFNAKANEYSLVPRNFMGKKLYEKTSLYSAIHKASEWKRGPLRGNATEPGSPGLAEAAARLARYEKRRSRT